jgi:hypothetical protein
LKKPAKTREELEAAIRLEMEDICEWPMGLAISVVPHEDSWKVVIMTDGPQDADRCDMIETIAEQIAHPVRLEGLTIRGKAEPLKRPRFARRRQSTS